MQKNGRIPMTAADGTQEVWTVRRDGSIWLMETHDGNRKTAATWRELVDRFCATADNYNLNHRLS